MKTSGNAGYGIIPDYLRGTKTPVDVVRSGRGVRIFIESITWGDGRVFKPVHTRYVDIVEIDGLKATRFEVTFENRKARFIFRDLNGWFVMVRSA